MDLPFSVFELDGLAVNDRPAAGRVTDAIAFLAPATFDNFREGDGLDAAALTTGPLAAVVLDPAERSVALRFPVAAPLPAMTGVLTSALEAFFKPRPSASCVCRGLAADVPVFLLLGWARVATLFAETLEAWLLSPARLARADVAFPAIVLLTGDATRLGLTAAVLD